MSIFESSFRKTLLAGLAATALALPAFSPSAGAAPKAEGAARIGYLTTEDGVIVTNDYGECWHTPWWQPEHAVAGCDPLAEPVPESKATAPLPILTARVLFEFDRYRLDETDHEVIDGMLAGVPEGAGIGRILLRGHACRIGTEKYNLRLSERRAQSVKDYIERAHDIGAGLIETQALGESEPAVQCADGLGWKALVECLAPNRRVEMELRLR